MPDGVCLAGEADTLIENRVSILMGARRIGITDLAREAGVSYNTAYGLYRGTTRRVDFDTLEKLCRYFDCSVCDIFAYTATVEHAESDSSQGRRNGR